MSVSKKTSRPLKLELPNPSSHDSPNLTPLFASPINSKSRSLGGQAVYRTADARSTARNAYTSSGPSREVPTRDMTLLPSEKSLLMPNISPITFEPKEVPSWHSEEFGGRGATSQTFRNGNSGREAGSMLPGLLNSAKVQGRLLQALPESASWGHPIRSRVDAFPMGESGRPLSGSPAPSHALTSAVTTSSASSSASAKKLFRSNAASYAVEAPRKLHPEENSVEIDDWAYKVVQKFHGSECRRPVSRSSSRLSCRDSAEFNNDEEREMALRTRSLGRFQPMVSRSFEPEG